MKKFKEFIKDDNYTLYHGTSSGRLESIQSKPNKLFLTTDLNVAIYYSSKGGEDYFLTKEIEFEKKYGETPDSYFNTQDNGELIMFKSLYPKNETPIVIKFSIPKKLIKNINNFIGYKGGELLVDPKYITEVIYVNWDDLDY
jgi:hypothetical protein